MRVLHVIQGYYPWVGGSQRVFQEVSERLVADGHRVTVLTTDAGDLEHFWSRGRRTVGPASEVVNGVEVLRFPVERRIQRAFWFSVYRRIMAELSDLPVDTTALLRRLVRFTPRVPGLERYLVETEEHFDLVNGANITLDFMLRPAWEWARARRVPWVITPFVHLGTPGEKRVRRYYTMRQQLELVRSASAVITQTTLESDYLAGKGVPRERLALTGSGINPAEVTGGEGRRFRDKYGLEGPIVFAVGTLAYDKGTVQTIEAMRRLWAQGSTAHLVLAGQPLSPVRRYLEKLPPDLSSRLHVLGFISEEEKKDLLAAGDVFCLPSCVDSFGIVYLEAWANGLPVIGARAGGVPAVIEEGADGLLVSFGDVAELAQAIGALLADPARAQAMGLRGRSKVRAQMTWDKVYERIVGAYSAALKVPLY